MKITINNYEEWMIDYIEGNLSNDQRKQLAEFLEFHPELKAELELFEQTKLHPDTNLVFANKELLKKKENGRVITMMSWVKYSVAVAAVLMVFIGVRYFNNDTAQPMAIKKYEYQNTETQVAFDRNTDSVTRIKNDEKEPQQQYYAEEKKELKVQDENKDGQEDKKPKLDLQREDINTITGIELAHVEEIKMDPKHYDVNSIENVKSRDDKDLAKINKKDKEITNISLNDNNTVVDWWNDAVAIGGEMENVVSGILEYDFDPFEKKTGGEEVLKTRSVNIFGFNYYSRKKTNN